MNRYLLIASALITAGCSIWRFSHPDLSRVGVGMTKAEVIRELGKPDRVAVQDGVEVLSYGWNDPLYLQSRSSELRGIDVGGVPGRPCCLEAMSLFVRSAPPPSSPMPWSIRGCEPASTRLVGAGTGSGGPERESRTG
jgi:hypothetical protein